MAAISGSPGEPGRDWQILAGSRQRERLYLDALKQDEGRCGLGGKVNTNPGKQNARFRGSKICANRAIRGGEEIFVPYGGNFKLEREIVDDERDGWGVFGRRFFRDMG